MAAIYDLLLTGARVVDPANGIDEELDVGLVDGKVAEVGTALAAGAARNVVDLPGKVVMPGIIDPHVHLSGRFGRPYGHRMMAGVGVTTAFELAGDGRDLVAGVQNGWGAGLSIAYLLPLVPGETIAADPSEGEIRTVAEKALAEGALGLKILGGHFPFTPAVTERILDVADDVGCHVAVHAGTTETGSNIEGLEELVRLAAGRRIHVAHVNSYCRGQVTGDPVAEARRAIAALQNAPHLVSESYLSRLNGTTARCSGGVPESDVTKTCLERAGYTADEAGLEAAVVDGYAQIQVLRAGRTALVRGDAGVRAWREANTDVGVSFPVNDAAASFLVATAKSEERFAVTAFSTDGGSIPRNTTVEQGLALVRYGALSLEEFVFKASTHAARILGIKCKGHLRPGADGDITVLDLDTGKATLAIAGGEIVMIDGLVIGSGCTFITREQGRSFFVERGCNAVAFS